MADLLNQANHKYSNWKIVILAILEIGSAFLLGFYGQQTLLNFNYQNLLFFLADFVFFLIISFFVVILAKEFIWPSIIFFLASGTASLVFYEKFSSILLVAALAMWLFLLWGRNRIRAELKDSLKIKFFRLAKVFFSKAVFGIAVFLTLIVYLTIATENFPVSFPYFQLLLQPSEKTLAFFIPDFNLQKPLQIILNQLAENQLTKAVPNFENLPLVSRNLLIKEFVQEGFLKTIEQFAGPGIDLQQPAVQTIFNVLQTKFGQLSDKNQTAVIVGVFIFFFLLLKTILLPLKWLASLIGFFIYLLLLAFDFIDVSLEASSKEIIT